MLVTILSLVGISLLLAVGDVQAKIADASGYQLKPTCTALTLWVLACVLWLPAMKLPGFTRLIAMADSIGLVMVAVAGYLFLGERLAVREIAGVALALIAIILLSSA